MYKTESQSADWLLTPLGQTLTEQEMQWCRSLIPSAYYARGLQVGLATEDYLQAIGVMQCYLVDTEYAADSQRQPRNTHVNTAQCPPLRTVADADALPFPERSQDLIILPHTLDFSENPHEVLRQAHQTLTPEGCLATIGFNQYSLYGMCSALQGYRRHFPWSGRYFGIRRVQDWLSLLGHDLAGARIFAYSPPIQSAKWRDRLGFMESAGDRWWPAFGGVYIIVSRKREVAMTPASSAKIYWRQLIPGIAQPASRRAAKTGLRLVKSADN